jgi:membrane protein
MPTGTTEPRPTVASSPKLWKLGGLGPVQLARNVAGEIRRNRSLGRASELAFDFLFALFPLIFFVLALFGLFASRSQQLQQNFISYFGEFVPGAAYQLLRTVITELAASAGGGKLTLGLVLAVWFGSGGVSSAISALNRVREERSWLRVRAVAVALTLTLSVLLLAALFLALATGKFMDWLGAELGLEPYTAGLWRAARWPASIFFVLISYSLIYFFAPDLDQRRWHWITPGAAFGVVVWLAVSEGFRIYLRFFNTYGASYGSLGALMILLAWLYLTALSFLIGGTINAEVERARTAQEKKN